MAYTQSDAEGLSDIITKADNNNLIKYWNVSRACLDTGSLFIQASLDAKVNWQNNIFHNSRYVIFSLHNDGKMELLSRGMKMPKFRKCKVKSLEDIAEKLIEYFEGVE